MHIFSFNKKRIKKSGAAILVSLMLLIGTGCGHSSTVGNAGSTVFKFGSQNISFGEVYIYAETVIEGYKSTYGENVFAMEIIDEDGASKSLEEVARKDIIEDIVRVKILNEKAADYEVGVFERILKSCTLFRSIYGLQHTSLMRHGRFSAFLEYLYPCF